MASITRRGRLTKSRDFDRIYRDGKARAGRYVIVYRFSASRSQDAQQIRLGVSVSRRLGNAVRRNRIKRVLKDTFWSIERLPDGYDYVLVARPPLAEALDQDSENTAREELRQLVCNGDGSQDG